MTTPDAYSLALGRLTVREYGENELLAYLRRKGIEKEEAVNAIKRLKAEGALSERRYILAMIRAQAARGKGAVHIRSKLQQKGVHVSTCELRELLGEAGIEDETETIRKLIERRYASANEDPAVWRRAYQAMLRRGFSSGAIRKVLGDLE